MGGNLVIERRALNVMQFKVSCWQSRKINRKYVN